MSTVHTKTIGTTFTDNEGRKYEVVEDVDHLNKRSFCDAPCAFSYRNQCRGTLGITGDCKAYYREDGKSVYFRRVHP